MAAATAAAVGAGVWLRPFRDLVYTMPPYILSDEEIDLLASRCAARADMQPSDVLAVLNTVDDASFGVRGLCNHIIGSYQKGE